MSIPVRQFLKARRDRALGSILGYTEREIFPKMVDERGRADLEAQRKFRQLVLDALNSYHDSALDLFKSDVGSLHNDEVIALLEKINDRLDRAG